MLLVKEGHLSELTALFDRHQVSLYNFFLRLTGDQASSEDLTQNLFYRVIRYRQSFQPAQGTFRSWIYRMARNVHVDFCKQESRGRASSPTPKRWKNGWPTRAAAIPRISSSGSTRRAGTAGRRPARGTGAKPVPGLEIQKEIARIRDKFRSGGEEVQVFRALKQLRTIYFKQI